MKMKSKKSLPPDFEVKVRKREAEEENKLKLTLAEQPLKVITESQCSVEINMSVKGVVGYTVKAYADTAEEARKRAVAEFKALRKEFKN